MGLSDFFGIQYKLKKSEGFDEFLVAHGVGYFLRKIADNVSPVVELSESGGEYTLTSKSTFKNMVTKFKLGEEFDEETPDGRMVKSIITQEGDNKLVHVMKGEKVSKILREFTKDEVVMTLQIDDIISKRIYTAQ